MLFDCNLSVQLVYYYSLIFQLHLLCAFDGRRNSYKSNSLMSWFGAPWPFASKDMVDDGVGPSNGKE